MKSSNQLYIPGVDHLRALAAFLVVCYHCIHSGNLVAQSYVPGFAPLSLLEEGHSGVALFITITGFIFTFIIGDRQVDYGRFLFNRFLRIFPLLFILSLFAAFVTQGVQEADPLATLKFFNLFGGGTYWGTWTLVVEFQFYLFFPVFYQHFRDRLPGRWRKYLPYLGVILLALCFRLIFWSQQGNVQDIGYWTIFGRIDQFMLGVVACLLLKDLEAAGIAQQRWFAPLLAAASLFLLVVVYHGFNQRLLFITEPQSPSLWWLVVPTIEGLLYGGLLLGWVLLSRRWQGPVTKGFAYLGAISYSTYLIHFGVLLFVLQMLPRLGLQLSSDVFTHKLLMGLLLVYPLTLLLSVLSYELVEKPFFSRRVNYIKPITRDD
jgi:peptidoglycan/LPS O-acetylase OafA/YrhL